jgi:PAS domain S-box-containing protein
MNYEGWTREQLAARIGELEARAAQTPNNALIDSEERIRAIVETAVEGIITIDERGLIESLNSAAERLFGYTKAELIGRNVKVLMPSPDQERHDEYLENYHRTGKARIIGIGREVVGLRKDGSVFPMDLSVGEVRLAGRRLYTGIVRDITVRKRQEEQLAEMARTLGEKNKELETIVYVASHDLRSPLVNIQGFSRELAHACREVRELIQNSGDSVARAELERLISRDVPEAIEYILAGVNKIDTLLSGFLRFSRLGRAALKLERQDLNALLRNVARTMEFQLKEAGASVMIDPLPPCVGDSVQLTHVFTNLIDNAIKYRKPNEPLSVRISAEEIAGQVRYAVSDNGIGIPSEHQGKIFEIFHRLNPGKTEGEGLGLAIAQRSLERQNGKITVESVPGQGTTFFVFLPRATR